MDERVEFGKVTVSSLMAGFITITEDNTATRLLLWLGMLMLFDFMLGWARAKKYGEWQSYKARWGVLGKLFEFGFIAIAYGFDWVFGTEIIKQAFIVYFCLVEVGSLLENAHRMGVPIPKEVVVLATKSKYFFGWFLVKKLENILAATFKMDYKDMAKIAHEEKEKEEKREDGNEK